MEKAKKNQEITIKNETKHNFIIVYDTIYKNTTLTTDEIALIIKLLAIAPNFKPTKEKLMSLLHIGKIAINKAIKGLKDKGYLTIKRYGNISEWTITQEPLTNLTNTNKETLINALINDEISMKQLKQLHKLKYIDDLEYQEIATKYIDYIRAIISKPWINKE